MKVLRGHWDGWETGPTAVAVGVFDGVHLGHQAVLRQVMGGDAAAAVLTFDPHPVAVVAPEHAPPLLTSLERRLELFADAGIEVVAVATFDDELRQMTPRAFCSDVLVGGLGAEQVVVGADFHFGRDRAGTPQELTALGAELGFGISITELVGNDDGISSSTIRRAVADGDVETAAQWLGRNFRVTGSVVRGDGRGAVIGFPTANLDVAAGLAIPGRGVYAVIADVAGLRQPAVANVGVRPTFGEDETDIVEVHLLDFDDDLYGKELSADFIVRIRDEMAFDGIDELVAQIGRDVEAARTIHTS